MRFRKVILLSTACFLFCLMISNYVFSADYNKIAMNTNASSNSSYSNEFISHLVKCQSYKEECSVEFFGTPITSVVEVRGWNNGKCEYVNYSKNIPQSRTYCRFSKSQLDEILATSKKDPNTQDTYSNGTMSYKADPLSVLFTQYMNDSATCVIPK